MKGVVFGAGFLGTRIAGYLEYEVVPRSRVELLNIEELKSFLREEEPEVVINAAGKTGKRNIDWCESNKEATMQSNVSAAINLSTACSERGAYFVHLGSGCIYQGNNNGNGFSEEEPPNFYGQQIYADTKILAEMALKNFPGLLLRIRLPVDDQPHERNLIDKLLKYQRVINAQNSITTVPHMLVAIKELIGKRREGIYNLVNPGTISAAEIMTMYGEIVDPDHKFESMTSDDLEKETVGKRTDCYLSTAKLIREGIMLPEIHEAVRECLLNYKKLLK